MLEHLVLLLEEPSAEDFFRAIIPRIVPKQVEVHYMVFEGKQDLERQLSRRLRGWIRPSSGFLVMRDQDSGDCRQVKARLADLCRSAGRPDAVVRIACRELESFFLGDLNAVATAFGRPAIMRHVNAAKFRNPDALGSPVEELRRFLPDYQKRDGARRISPLLHLDESRSTSFLAVVSGVRKMIT